MGSESFNGISKRLERVEKDLKKKKEPFLEHEKGVLEKCKAHLEAEKPLRELELTAEERRPISGFLFLSQRPMLYVLNLGDDEAAEMDKAVEKHKLGALQGRPNTALVAVCGRLEVELAEMDEKETTELLASYGLKEPGLNRMIRATYDLMGLFPFFTAGEPEVRAWTIRKGSTAVKAAGAIHSDIEKGFIRAEVVRWDDLLAARSLGAAREKGQVRLEGRSKLPSRIQLTWQNSTSPTYPDAICSFMYMSVGLTRDCSPTAVWRPLDRANAASSSASAVVRPSGHSV
jgi:ribosome-binding ATPase YchF (GTP1/OBG family)